MKNLYKEYQKNKSILGKDFLLLSNGKDFMAFNENAEAISKTFTTNLISKADYSYTVFNHDKFNEVLKNKHLVSVAYCEFDTLGNVQKR